jgi:hypothetical protein
VDNTSKNYVILPLLKHRLADALFGPTLNTIVAAKSKADLALGLVITPVATDPAKLQTDPASKKPLYTFLEGKTFSRAYYVPAPGDADPPPPQVIISDPQDLALDGDAGELATSDWVIAQRNSQHQAASIVALTEGENNYVLQLSPSLNAIDTLFGDFEIDIRPVDYDVNETPVFATNPELRSNNHSTLPLDLATVPALLDIGRTLIIAGRRDAMAVTVKEVDASRNRIRVEPAIPGSELTMDGTTQNYTRYHTIIYGNVVDAGHGETQKQTILSASPANDIRCMTVFVRWCWR